MSARYVVGELVDLVVRGARVETVDERYVEICYGTSDGGSAFISAFPSPQVRFTRVAPPEWPPQPGDVWGDAHGGLWWAREVEGAVQLQSQKGGVDEADWTLGQYGPMRLEYRKGWSPAPAADVEAEPEKLDERASFIAGIRELADYVEAHPVVPIDRYTFDAQYFISNHAADEADAYDHLHTIADELGEKPFLPEDPIAAHPLVKKRFSGGVTYEAVIVVSSLRRRAELMAARTPKPEDLTPPGTGDAPAADVAAEAAGAPDFNLGPVDPCPVGDPDCETGDDGSSHDGCVPPAVKQVAHVCEYVEPDGATMGVCHLPGLHGGRDPELDADGDLMAPDEEA